MRKQIVSIALALLAASAAIAQTAAPPVDVPEEFAKAVFFGKKFADLKEYGTAYEQFARADALKPDQPAVLYNMAVLLAMSGRYSDAQAKVDRYMQLFPTGAEKSLVAKLQLELDFQRELQKKRQTDVAYTELFNRAKFLFTRNELPAALKAFQEAQEQRPTDAAAVFNEAVILQRMGELGTASERFHRYMELETDADLKAQVEQRIFALENEIEDTKTKIVCPFCGFKLPAGATWCPHCWHGPYMTSSSVWNTRPCVDGASATRATYFADNRFNKNDALPCLSASGTLAESLRYTPARQHNIQDARKAEGWTYNGDIIQSWTDKEGNQVQYVQGADYCERVVASSGETLTYAAHATANGIWLLDREDMMIDGQLYTIRRTFDNAGRIAHEAVQYQNAAACDHIIDETADYTYQNDQLVSVKLAGGYDGYPAEGAPRADWQGTVAYAYDNAARVTKEDLAITSWTKTYKQKPYGALRDDISKLYVSMRPNRPIENLARTGDLCATSGSTLLGNRIDLRPFYTMSPNLAFQLPWGVTRATVSFTYPDSFKVR